MSTPKQRLVRFHVQQYVRATMAEKLIAEGFVCTNQDDLHWYRVVNKEVVHYVLFHVYDTTLPVDLSIGFGCIPLFLEPPFPTNLYVSAKMQRGEVFYPGYPVLKDHNRYAYSDQILVTCPADEYRGADILDRVIAIFNKTQSAKACYEYHNSTYVKAHEAFPNNSTVYGCVTADFVDEVIFWNDEEVLPLMSEGVESKLTAYYTSQQRRKLEAYETEDLLRFEKIKEALDGNLAEYRDYLESRKKRTVQLLAKKVGIRF